MALLDGRDEGGLAFRVLGIPVRVQLSFLVVSVLMASRRQDPALVAVWVVVVFVSVLVHELGHAAAYRAFGQRPTIVLYGMGGLTRGGTLSTAPEIVVCLAGPAVGFVLGGAAWFIERATFADARSLLLATVLRDLIWANVGWGIVNLLPILPLDGAQALRALVRERAKDRTDDRIRIVSTVTAAGACGVALERGMIWAAFLALWLGAENGRAVLESARMRRDHAEHGAALDEGYARLDDDPAAAEAIGRSLLEKARSEDLRWKARHLVACACLEEKKAEAAVEVLSGCSAQLPADPGTLGGALAAADRHAEAIPLLEEALQRAPEATSAGVLVATLLKEGRLDEALAALDRHAPIVSDQATRAVGAALFYAGRHQASQRLHEALFARAGVADDAYNVGCCLARLGRADEAVAWLRRAVDAGYADRQEPGQQMATDEDLASLRGRPDFQQLAARLDRPASLPSQGLGSDRARR
jgi:Zn-dependent protease